MRLKPWQTYNLPPPKSEASTGKLSLIDYEIYSGIEVPNKAFFVRLDGWAFHSLAKKLKLKKPFDKRFAAALAATAKELFIPFNPVLAYIFSDEINFLFLKNPTFRRIEKIDSVFAGFASAKFSLLMKMPAAFDCRAIPVGKGNIAKYMIWRQAEAFRNHNNAWAQFVLVKAGMSARTAAKRLAGLKVPELKKLTLKHKVDLNKTPTWQRKGVLLYWQEREKKGYDPIKKKHVIVKRRRIKIDWNPPSFSSKEGRNFLKKITSLK